METMEKNFRGERSSLEKLVKDHGQLQKRTTNTHEALELALRRETEKVSTKGLLYSHKISAKNYKINFNRFILKKRKLLKK